VAQIAKEIFGIQNVLARVYDPQREEIYSEFGLQTFCPTNLMAASARGILIEQEKPKTLQIGTHTMHFYEVAAPRQVYDCDVSLVELEKDHSLFALRRKNGALELCDGRKLTIRKGDQLVICVVAD
jgi:trk system potassium uptake protein TrkA